MKQKRYVRLEYKSWIKSENQAQIMCIFFYDEDKELMYDIEISYRKEIFSKLIEIKKRCVKIEKDFQLSSDINSLKSFRQRFISSFPRLRKI